MIYPPPLTTTARKKGARGGHWRFLLDDKINALNSIAAEPSPAGEVYRTAGTILALVRVSALPALTV